MYRARFGDISRRRFLQVGAAALGAVAAPARLNADEAKNPYGGFTVGVQSYCFREFDLEGALKRTHDLGLHFMEFFQKHAPLQSTPRQVEALLALCREYQITPVAYGVQSFTKNHDRNKKIFDLGKALGIKTFSADPDPDSFDSLDKLVSEYRIAIAIHPHGPLAGKLHRWYSAEVILAAVKDHDPRIGSCLDTGHLIRAAQLGKNLDPAEQIRIMGGRNFAIHLKDHDNTKRTDVVYGKGTLDVPAVIRALRDVKFRGHISIEYEAHPENPSPDMRACLDVLRSAVG
jgi:sugar phosphate isomerase/epimerase